MKKSVRISLLVLLAVIFVCSLAVIVSRYFSYRDAVSSATDAQKIAGMLEPEIDGDMEIPEELPPQSDTPNEDFDEFEVLPQIPSEKIWVVAPIIDDPYIETLAAIDLNALREVNPDVIGWIYIPETTINYPLLQAPNNDRYLGKDWKRQESLAGAIFLECQNSPELTDFSTIIYGHNMFDGSMFSELHSYKSQEFADSHPYIYIVSDAGVYRYTIFAAYEAPVRSTTYRLGFDEESKAEFIEWGLSQSVIDTDIEPYATDRMLTLSTCTGNGHTSRWVVQARLRMIAENIYEI